MKLYSGTAPEFIRDSVRNQIAEKLKSAFFSHYHYYPSKAEVGSWQNSLRAMAQVVQYAELDRCGVFLEYQLPQSSKRLDCMFTGRSIERANSAIIVELKQWETCSSSDGENEVATWVGGSVRDVLHPSAQVGQYRNYLKDSHTAFYEGENPISLEACSYLHNYRFGGDDELLAPKFERQRELFPIFSADDVDELSKYLSDSVSHGDGLPVLQRIETGKCRPSKMLMQHVADVIKRNANYVLLNEQLVVFDKVLAAAASVQAEDAKRILLIKGGPGTGKSVIALNLMAELLERKLNAHYATGSKAFTETLRKVIGPRGAVQFKYFNSYMKTGADEVDVLICDEAHRIRKTSNNQYTPRARRSDTPQIEELLNAARVGVYFIDDAQIVRPGEIGSTEIIRETAKGKGIEVLEFELEAQFRCGGSAAFLNWIDNTLGVRPTANVLWSGDEQFEFKIFDRLSDLDSAIRDKANAGFKARVTAGFCWPWSKPKIDGTLENDVVIEDFARPWNARPDSGRLAPGIPKSSLWATEPGGIEQIGCVYTAQGFEFDYVGVIWGRDLLYRFDDQQWVGDRNESHDSVVRRAADGFLNLIKHTYRVLLTRGMKGCYVCFLDRETQQFVKSRMESPVEDAGFRKVAESEAEYQERPA